MTKSNKLPFPLRFRIIFSRWMMVFSAVALLTVVIFLLAFDFDGYFKGWRLGDKTEVNGTVTYAEWTGVSINEVDIMQYDYTFASPEIGEWFGTSYGPDGSTDVGQTVVVQYNSDNPMMSRIQGLDTSTSGFFGMLAFLVFFIPMILLLRFLFKKGKLKLKIIQNGTLAEGKLVEEKETGMRINDQPVIAYKFEYSIGSSNYYVTTKTHEVDKIGDERTELIVFHNDYPEKAIVVDSLPSGSSEYIKKNWRN